MKHNEHIYIFTKERKSILSSLPKLLISSKIFALEKLCPCQFLFTSSSKHILWYDGDDFQLL